MINTKITLNFSFALNQSNAVRTIYHVDHAKNYLSNHYYNDDKIVRMIDIAILKMNSQELDAYTTVNVWSNSFSQVEVTVELENMPE